MYVVMKRFGRVETRVQEFSKEIEAFKFILEKLREDRSFKLSATYCLYEGADMLKEYTQDDIPSETEEGSETGGDGSQRGSGKSFNPTPFNTTPRMGPQTWIKDEDEDKDNH